MIRRFFARPALVALAVLTALLPAEVLARSNRDPLRLHLGFWTGYDDNILQLSGDEIDELRDEPGSDRFRIESEDDVVSVAGATLEWRLLSGNDRRTIFRFNGDLYRYHENGIKDYEIYGVRLSQEVNTTGRHRSWLGAEYRRTPSRYSREVTDDDASAAAGTRIRDSLAYDEDRLDLSYHQRILGRDLEAGGEVRVRVRDYDDDFDERDGIITDLSLRLRGRPWSRTDTEIGGRLELGAYAAEGDLPGTPIQDDDVSYEFTAGVLEADFPFGRHHQIDIRAERERRVYTTDLRRDRARYHRKDVRITLSAGYEYEITRRLSVWGTVQHRDVAADLPASAGTTLDEETDYQETRASVGVEWELRF